MYTNFFFYHCFLYPTFLLGSICFFLKYLLIVLSAKVWVINHFSLFEQLLIFTFNPEWKVQTSRFIVIFLQHLEDFAALPSGFNHYCWEVYFSLSFLLETLSFIFGVCIFITICIDVDLFSFILVRTHCGSWIWKLSFTKTRKFHPLSLQI